MLEFFRRLFGYSEPWVKKVKVFRFRENAPLPVYGHYGDVACDVVAMDHYYDAEGNTCYPIGLGFEVPRGYGMLILPRSSNARTNLRLTNSLATIDPGYTGEVVLKFRNDQYAGLSVKEQAELHEGKLWMSGEYDAGERIGQIILVKRPYLEFEVVSALGESSRGSGGFGSTGK